MNLHGGLFQSWGKDKDGKFGILQWIGLSHAKQFENQEQIYLTVMAAGRVHFVHPSKINGYCLQHLN